ncbi:MAG: restriction endonuclease, partial [Dolichospermum sp.]
LNESQTEEEFIKPALEILGFKYIPQVITHGKGRSQRPDYALFSNTETRDIAYTLQTNETAFYNQVLAIAEAKYWERQLSKVSANDQRDIFKNENPSFQISSYLTGTNVDWGILTNGREWRLYYRLASSTATE